MKPAARAKPPPPVIEIAPAENTDAFANTPTSISGKEGGIEVFECEMKDAAATCDWYKGDTKIDSSSFRYKFYRITGLPRICTDFRENNMNR